MPDYSISGLRNFDKEIFKTANHIAYRVIEPVPLCWMCSNPAGKNSTEHIFAQTLLKEFATQYFTPYRSNSLIAGGKVTHSRGPFTGNALTVNHICSKCNNGWMSRLESTAKPLLLKQDDKKLSQLETAILSRWFVKTAVTLNISQPYRLLWDASQRHSLADGIPPNVIVTLRRADHSEINWGQNPNMNGVFLRTSSSWNDKTTLTLEKINRWVIQVGSLIGIVIQFPGMVKILHLDETGVIWRNNEARGATIPKLPIVSGIEDISINLLFGLNDAFINQL